MVSYLLNTRTPKKVVNEPFVRAVVFNVLKHFLALIRCDSTEAPFFFFVFHRGQKGGCGNFCMMSSPALVDYLPTVEVFFFLVFFIFVRVQKLGDKWCGHVSTCGVVFIAAFVSHWMAHSIRLLFPPKSVVIVSLVLSFCPLPSKRRDPVSLLCTIPSAGLFSAVPLVVWFMHMLQ